MKIAVYPHDLALGGSQLNAIEIAAEVTRLGHPCVVVGRPGVLVERVLDLGLEFIELPAPSRRPSRRVALALRELVGERELDLIHGYEWPPTLEAIWASHGRRARVVSTVMSMAVAPFIPKSLPLAVGTAQIVAAEHAYGRMTVQLIEPPVDLANHDDQADYGAAEFRSRYGIRADEVLVVVVTRLAHQLKLEGLLTAIETVGQLAADGRRIRLAIVGAGPAAGEVATQTLLTNERTGAETVILTGELADPRAAYSAADIALGMGGSALRAMAFGKPLIVQGELGFWSTLTLESVGEFLWAGWYGRGAGPQLGRGALTAALTPLLDSADSRAALGRFGRSLVEQRFSVTAAATRQIALYQAALDAPVSPLIAARDEVTGGLRYAGYYAAKRFRRALGRHQADDFNVRPVSGSDGRTSTGSGPVAMGSTYDPSTSSGQAPSTSSGHVRLGSGHLPLGSGRVA